MSSVSSKPGTEMTEKIILMLAIGFLTPFQPATSQGDIRVLWFPYWNETVVDIGGVAEVSFLVEIPINDWFPLMSINLYFTDGKQARENINISMMFERPQVYSVFEVWRTQVYPTNRILIRAVVENSDTAENITSAVAILTVHHGPSNIYEIIKEPVHLTHHFVFKKEDISTKLQQTETAPCNSEFISDTLPTTADTDHPTSDTPLTTTHPHTTPPPMSAMTPTTTHPHTTPPPMLAMTPTTTHPLTTPPPMSAMTHTTTHPHTTPPPTMVPSTTQCSLVTQISGQVGLIVEENSSKIAEKFHIMIILEAVQTLCTLTALAVALIALYVARKWCRSKQPDVIVNHDSQPRERNFQVREQDCQANDLGVQTEYGGNFILWPREN